MIGNKKGLRSSLETLQILIRQKSIVGHNIYQLNQTKQMYKFYTEKRYWPSGQLPKILLIMKLTTVLMIATLLQVSAAGFAQNLTFSKKNASLEQIFQEIEKQTGYTVVYSDRQLNDQKKLNVNFHSSLLSEVMDYCLKNQMLDFTIEEKTIVVKQRTPSFLERISFAFDRIDVYGMVVGENNVPLIGATVVVKGTNLVIRTNTKGSFYLEDIDENAIIEISYIGYKTKEIKASKELGMISMEILSGDLSQVEIVSTGYQSIPKERATGAFTVVDNKTLNRNVGANILDRLESVTSGLLLNRGLPMNANNSKFSIRGRSTIFANAEPLIVLDGLPYEGTIEQINPADIESINVLKDAAAASIWGTRASNGVIVITSKKGAKNTRTEISINSTLTVNDRPDVYYIKGLSSAEYIDMEQFLYRQGYYNAQLSTNYSSISAAVEIFNQKKQNLITAADSASRINELKIRNIRKDLDRYMYRPAVYQQYQVSVRGGTENNTYYFSGGYDKNLENLVSESYDRLSLNATNTYSAFKDHLKINSSIYLSSSNNKKASLPYTPTVPYERLVDENGNPTPVVNGSTLRQSYIDTAGRGKLLDWNYRPLEELDQNSQRKNFQYRINLGVDLKIIEGLNLTSNYQYMRERIDSEILNDVNSFYTRDLLNRFSSIVNGNVVYGIPYGQILSLGQSNLTSQIIRAQLNFNRTIAGDHEFNVIAGYEGGDTRSPYSGYGLYGFDPDLKTNSNATIDQLKDYRTYYDPNVTRRFSVAPSNAELINITQAFYANASYSYKGRYIASGSVRKDESNLFGVESNQKGVPLWSSGLAWIIDNESFYDLSWLPNLKLRATFGYNGNVDKSISAYLTVQDVGLLNDFGSNYSKILNPPNPDLRWEKVRTWNLGLDFGSKEARITGSIDWYSKDALDLIGNNNIAMQSGVSMFRGNGANTRTRGIDLLLNSINLTGNLKWTTTLLFNYNTDKVTSYKVQQGSNNSIINSNYDNPIEGYPYYAIFSFPSAGLNNMGMPQGYLNGEISTDYSKILGQFKPEEMIFHGSASPRYFGSIINTIGYKGLQLSFNISYKFDYFFRRPNLFSGFEFQHIAAIDGYERRWQQSGDENYTRIPAFVYPQSSGSDSFFLNSEDAVEPADHIRLQDIRLSYDLNKLLKKSPFKSVNIFGYAKNIGVLWSKTKSYVDPDYGVYTMPQPRSYSIGLNLTF